MDNFIAGAVEEALERRPVSESSSSGESSSSDVEDESVSNEAHVVLLDDSNLDSDSDDSDYTLFYKNKLYRTLKLKFGKS